MALLQKAYLGSTKLFKEKSWFEEVSAKPITVSSTVTLTASTTTHTKGSYSEIIASTGGNSSYMIVEAGTSGFSGNVAALIDIATGASGSESVLIGDVAIGHNIQNIASRANTAWGVPIKVASGTRLAARIQSATASQTYRCRIRIFSMGDYAYAPTAIDVIGTSTSTSAGTAMSGASGTWVQLTASTANAYRAVVILPSASDAAFPSGNRFTEYTLGTGAAGSEIEYGRTMSQIVNDQSIGMSPNYPPIASGAVIPAGTRLAVKHDHSSDPGDFDITLIGIR